MNEFANYDPRMWFDKVFSRHPRKAEERRAAARSSSSHLTRFAITTAAVASLFVMQDVSQLPSVGQHVPISENQITTIDGDAVYWLETTASSVRSELAGFEAHAAAVAQQLLTGSLSNVSAETLEFARAALNRSRLDSVEWIANVARDVARLTD